MRNVVNNKKTWAIAGIIAVITIPFALRAVPITGSISMGGEANLNSTSLSAASAVTSWPLVYVVADSDSFSSISAFTTVNMSSSTWTFSPSPGVALNDLWNVGGFTFDFESDTVSQSGDFLDIDGTGTISGNGYDTTDFDWNLSFENPVTGGPEEFTFSAAAGSVEEVTDVPDGGVTVAFLGLALAGIEGLRRKLVKAS